MKVAAQLLAVASLLAVPSRALVIDPQIRLLQPGEASNPEAGMDADTSTNTNTNAAEKVAIIGAGAGGSSVAYYLNKYTGNSGAFDITVFEKLDRVGGRVETVDAYGDERYPVEVGASVFLDGNAIIWKAAQDFGFEIQDTYEAPNKDTRDTRDTDREKINTVGIYDGQKVVFQFDAQSSWLTGLKLFYKYGLSPKRFNNLVSDFGKSLEKYFYNDYFPFKGLQKVAEKSGLINYANTGALDVLKENDISEDFSRDILQAFTRHDYASNLENIHGLDALASLTTAAYNIKGGNAQVFQNFVKLSGAKLQLDTKVSKVKKVVDKVSGATKWRVTHSDSLIPEDFDQVVIAAPLYQTGIFSLGDLVVEENEDGEEQQIALHHKIPEVEYIKLHVTVFTSNEKISPDLLDVDKTSKVPDTILTTTQTESSIPFFSVFSVDYIGATDEYVYRIFSHEELSTEFIADKILNNEFDHGKGDDDDNDERGNGKITWIHRKVWDASYPKPVPASHFPDFKLHNGLYYLNTIESFISTMETAALAGANVAGLIAHGKNTTNIIVP